MSAPRALDLFCGAGGASAGLAAAGFDVVGIDIREQRSYVHPGRFIRADALAPPVDPREFDFIWASPPCQAFSSAAGFQRQHLGKRYPDLIAATRALLAASGALTCIENVPQAPIRCDLALDGTMFRDLKVIRRRHFELNFPAPFALGFDARGHVLRHGWSCVVGNGTCSWLRKKGVRTRNADHRKAMGIDWMPRDRLSQAVPPAYAEFIGRAVLRQLDARRAA
jgi:DNA (cytosine-5)-methyltransferase 1